MSVQLVSTEPSAVSDAHAQDSVPRDVSPHDESFIDVAVLEALLALLPDTVRVTDASGRFVRVGAAAAGPWGNDAPATLRALWERERPARADAARPLSFPEHPGMRALAGQRVERERLQLRRGAETDPASIRHVELWAAPVRDARGRVVGALLYDRDVTHETRAAEQAQQREQRIAELERQRPSMATPEESTHERRLAAVGQLAAGVIHDVNNVLNPIMAAAYLLQHHAESPAAVRDYAERIRVAAETGAATASRIGRFIRQEPLHAGGDEPVDLSTLANDVIDLTEPMRLRRSSDSGEVQLVRALGTDVHTRGLPGELRAALLNLVQNALDAMPSGGTLTVHSYVDGGCACIAVEDTGKGMSRETQERAFEPFYSTKGSGGSGLGLAEVYGIVRRHRGSAHIDSEPGRGTVVTLRLPHVRAGATTSESAPPASSEPLHVLVVEDHDDGREFLRRVLRTEGHTVDAVGTCADARERLASAGALSYHLLLTDVGLPDGSGWELAAFARERLPSLRIGVITGWEPMVGTEARAAEFVLRKPLRAAELLSHIAGRKASASTES